MTSNQIAAKQAAETERANRAREKETKRSNKAQEGLEGTKQAETRRSNRANEGIARRAQTITVRGQNIKGATDTLGSIARVASTFINDPAWYDDNPAATQMVANISYVTPLGSKISGLEDYTGRNAFPGVWALPFIPMLGDPTQTGHSAPANIASQKVYSYVRHANSGARNYEAVDYTMFLMGADYILSLIAHIERCLDIASTFSGDNKYLTPQLLRVFGFNDDAIEDAINNHKQYCGLLNIYINNLNSLYIPGVFYYMTRHMWLSRHVFVDAPTERGQIYAFYPAAMGFVNIQPSTNIRLEATKVSVSSLLTDLKNALDKYLLIEDIGIMSGDSLNAFGSENLIQVAPYEPKPVQLVYHEEVLAQIQGATLYGPVVSFANFSLYQRDGYIVQGNPDSTSLSCLVTVSDGGALATSNSIITDYLPVQAWYDNQSPRDNMVSIALTGAITDLDLNDLQAKVSNCGSEVICNSRIYWLQQDADSDNLSWHNVFVGNMCYSNNGASFSGTQTLISAINDGTLSYLVASFNKHPVVRIKDSDVATLFEYKYLSMDIERTAFVSLSTLDNMHQVALYSLFSIPSNLTRKV